jgi:glyoxylase-like metal-dependent hydrolase (beta-lactamase superfamily II)
MTRAQQAAGGSEEYEVIAVRYGTRTGARSEIYLNHHIYGEPDSPLGMDYYFWVARNAQRTVLIDTGFGRTGGARRSRTTLMEPVTALERLGIAADAVPQVVVTHAHYDHIGNLDRFPAAEVLINRREFEFWTGPYGEKEQFAWSVEAEETAYLNTLRSEGRLTLFEEGRSVAPGIEAVTVGGHTPGQALVLVNMAGGRTAVLASDAVHYYEELELERPFAFVADLEAMYRGFDRLRQMEAEGGRVIVPGHDPLVMERFPACGELPQGLGVRIG